MALLGPDVQNRGFPYQPANSWGGESIFSGEGCLRQCKGKARRSMVQSLGQSQDRAMRSMAIRFRARQGPGKKSYDVRLRAGQELGKKICNNSSAAIVVQ